MRLEMSIEVLDGAAPASLWADSNGDRLIELATGYGAREWHWHRHSWGVVLDLAFDDEEQWERFLRSVGVQAILDAIPDPVNGLILHRGWGGTSGSGEPIRFKPFAGAGAAELPIPEEEWFETDARGRRYDGEPEPAGRLSA